MTRFSDEADEHRFALCLMKSRPARICVPIRVPRASDLPEAIKRAAEVAHIVEVRLDFLAEDEREAALSLLRDHLIGDATPMILTCRPAEEGGHAVTDYATPPRF